MTSITLDPVTYQKLLDAERTLTGLFGEYDKAEECGIDCQNWRALATEAIARIQKLKQHYAPRQG